jgi:hypothetical protein
MIETLRAFFATEVGMVSQGVVLLSLVDFVFGMAAGIRAKTFSAQYVAEFVSDHLLARAFPIITLLFVGHFGGQALLLTAGLFAGTAYVAETAQSVISSLTSPKLSQAESGRVADKGVTLRDFEAIRVPEDVA